MLSVRQFDCQAVKKDSNDMYIPQWYQKNSLIWFWRGEKCAIFEFSTEKLNCNFSSLRAVIVLMTYTQRYFCTTALKQLSAFQKRDANEKPIIVDHKMKYLLKFPHWTWPRFEGESSSAKFSYIKMDFSGRCSHAPNFRQAQLFTPEILQLKVQSTDCCRD